MRLIRIKIIAFLIKHGKVVNFIFLTPDQLCTFYISFFVSKRHNMHSFSVVKVWVLKHIFRKEDLTQSKIVNLNSRRFILRFRRCRRHWHSNHVFSKLKLTKLFFIICNNNIFDNLFIILHFYHI